MSVTDRAKWLSDSFPAHDGNVLHIYDDGYILVVACSADRHLTIRKTLKEQWPAIEEARSSDGFLSVFVIPTVLSMSIKPDNDPLLSLLTDGYLDHRAEDFHTIEDAAELCRRQKRTETDDPK